MARPKGSKRPGIKYLTPSEWQKFSAELRHDPLYDFLFHLMLAVGGRVSEMANLPLSAVDERARKVQVQGVKGGLLGRYPIEKALWRKYRRWMRERASALGSQSSKWMFPSPATDLRAEGRALTEQAVKNKFKEVCASAGLSAELSVHALRHTCAVFLLRSGVSAPEIQEHLRQRTGDAVMQYLRLFGHEAEEKAERRADALSGFMR